MLRRNMISAGQRRFNAANAMTSSFSRRSSALAASTVMAMPTAAPQYQLQQKRTFLPGTGALAANLGGHFSGIMSFAACFATPLSSPYGTLLMLALSYNVAVVSMKHLWYTLEMTIRDYIQDVALAQMMRYMILITLMTCVFQTLIEA